MMRICSIFFCDKMGERVCCADCPQHPKNNGHCENYCLNSPDRCGALEAGRRKDRLKQLAPKSIEKFGADMQIIVAIEELSELQKALTKYLRKSVCAEVIANIHEEMVDVEIMLAQLKVIFGEDDGVRRKKLEHLAGLVKED